MIKKLSNFLSACIVFTFFFKINLIACDNQTIQLSTLSTITNLTQAAIWLNEERLAVGRWDGTITIFHCDESLSLLQALVPPNKEGITMLEKINDDTFVSSDGSYSIALWEHNDKKYVLKNTYHFNKRFGPADSARFLQIENQQFLLTGHSEGNLLIWKFCNKELFLYTSLNLQSDHPLESPYELWNIRSIVPWKKGIVITASEDGDLCMVDILQSKIVHRQKYNENAKRGINHICISGDYLLLSNCTVGSSDRNLWLYRIENNRFVCLDSKNLVVHENVEQVFSFDVGCICDGTNTYFLCSTQEGFLWFGHIKNDFLSISNFKKVSPLGGSALAIHPLKNRLASVSYDIHLLELSFD